MIGEKLNREASLLSLCSRERAAFGASDRFAHCTPPCERSFRTYWGMIEDNSIDHPDD